MIEGRRRGPRVAGVALLATGLLAAAPSAAEIVHLSTGRVMSVASSRYEGGRVILTLRGGGEITCPATLVARIAPDEIPPEPAAGTPAATRAPDRPLDGPFDDLIRAAARRVGLEADLLHAVIRAESSYRPRARSPKGARGLMQLMPAVLREYAVADPYDPGANIAAGARHLRRLLNRFPLDQALAAYNAGEGAVLRHGGVPPYPETRNYVQRILALLGGDGGGP